MCAEEEAGEGGGGGGGVPAEEEQHTRMSSAFTQILMCNLRYLLTTLKITLCIKTMRFFYEICFFIS